MSRGADLPNPFSPSLCVPVSSDETGCWGEGRGLRAERVWGLGSEQTPRVVPCYSLYLLVAPLQAFSCLPLPRGPRPSVPYRPRRLTPPPSPVHPTASAPFAPPPSPHPSLAVVKLAKKLRRISGTIPDEPSTPTAVARTRRASAELVTGVLRQEEVTAHAPPHTVHSLPMHALIVPCTVCVCVCVCAWCVCAWWRMRCRRCCGNRLREHVL